MNKTIKFSLVVVLVAAALLLVYFLVGALYFEGAFDKKYTRRELTENFTRHEKEFADLDVYFRSKVTKATDQVVVFELSGRKKVSLTINPLVIDPKNKLTGGTDLRLDDPKIDSAMALLGWTPETITNLREMLVKTNCDWISMADDGQHMIQMAPRQSGWGSFCYRILDKSIPDSLIHVWGSPISNSSLGKRVDLNYSSAL